MYHPNSYESEKFFIVAGDRVIFGSMANRHSKREDAGGDTALQFDIYVDRSYAKYLHDWLTDT